MAEALELLLRRLDDPRVRVAHVQAADTAREVDERVPVDVGEGRTLTALDHDGDVDGEGVGDHALLAVEDLARAGIGMSVRSSMVLVVAMGATIAEGSAAVNSE